METLTPRLQYIVKKYGMDLSSKVNLEAEIDIGHPVIEITDMVLNFANADPSHNKSATQWLIKTYLNNGFRFEDYKDGPTSKACETLQMFGLYRGKLESTQRDLNRYSTLAEVWRAIELFIPKENEIQENDISGKALKKLEKEQAYRESEILIDEPDGFKIVVPLTEFASKWWGRGTRWCTAANYNNYFEHYAKIAPLFIIMVPDCENNISKIRKFQMFATKDDFQFMDETDETVKHQDIFRFWDYIRPFYRHAIRVNNNIVLSHYDNYSDSSEQFNFLDYETLKWAVSKNGNLLSCFKTPLSQEIYDVGVAQCGIALEFVPGYWRKPETCLKAVKQNANALLFVPKDLRTKEICQVALENGLNNLKLIPTKWLSKATCLKAVLNSCRAFTSVPEKYLSDDFVDKVFAKHPSIIHRVPLKTYERYLMAVKIDPYMIDYVPTNMKTEEICRFAMRGLYTIEHIPLNIIPLDEVINNALRLQAEIPPEERCGLVECFPREALTYELCRKLIELYPWDIRWIPKEFKDKEMCMLALNLDSSLFIEIPETYMDQEAYNIIFEQANANSSWIPAKYQTPPMKEYLETHRYPAGFVAQSIGNDELKVIMQEWEEWVGTPARPACGA